jgi:hypothetical protein
LERITRVYGGTTVFVNLLNVMALNWRVFALASYLIPSLRFQTYTTFFYGVCHWNNEGNVWGRNNTVEKIT